MAMDSIELEFFLHERWNIFYTKKALPQFLYCNRAFLYDTSSRGYSRVNSMV